MSEPGEGLALHLGRSDALPLPSFGAKAQGGAEPAAVRVSRGQRTEVGETEKGGRGRRALKETQGRIGRRGVSVPGLHTSLGHAVRCTWAQSWARNVHTDVARGGGWRASWAGAAGAGARAQSPSSGGVSPLPVLQPAALVDSQPQLPAALRCPRPAQPGLLGFRLTSLCLEFAATSPDAHSQFHGLWAPRCARVRAGGWRRVCAALAGRGQKV